MRLRGRDTFVTVRTEGAILPSDLLQRIARGDRALEGLTPESYHLGQGERLNEAINRSWSRMQGRWVVLKEHLARLPEKDPATGVTRDVWLYPLFQELGFGAKLPTASLEAAGKSYPVSHVWQQVPIHLVGAGVDLDARTAGVAGAARTSPHSLVQEFLNRSDNHLWGLVSNGVRLRILRDNAALTRQAYVEFDLEALMEGQVYPDFALLWLLCHESRVESQRTQEEGDAFAGSRCWLERWSQAAQQQGARVMEDLKEKVRSAIERLGQGFLSHPANAGLRSHLQSGELVARDYYRQLLRMVYRLLFLCVAEERNLIVKPEASPEARDRYLRFYSVARLRRLAERRRGTQHVDLWRGLNLVFTKLGQDDGCPELGLPALGSFLWRAPGTGCQLPGTAAPNTEAPTAAIQSATPDLDWADLANRDLLEALRVLCFTDQGQTRRPVDFQHLGAEELGGVFESLLELHPLLNVHAATFALEAAAGNDRKSTGSYYTPESLVQCLLDSALNPVLDEACAKPNPEQAILDLKVCDPACGSGHFLVAAAHRMAKRLAALRTGDSEPSPEAYRSALRQVVGQCLYGVDINPMAVELCKVSLWMEAMEPGKPLSFLEHHVQQGNSLLGATPALLRRGIPDGAFQPLQGDDPKVCAEYRKLNKSYRQRPQLGLGLFGEAPWENLGDLRASMDRLRALDGDAIQGVHGKEAVWEECRSSSAYEHGRLLADAWCAAFVWRKLIEPNRDFPIHQEVLYRVRYQPHWVPKWMEDEICRLRDQYGFFHWHLAFPEVFGAAEGEIEEDDPTGWTGGFDVVLGNPPWERIKLQEKEWFSTRRPDIAAAPNADARRKLIASLATEDPALFAAWQDDQRQAEGESQWSRLSGRYPLCGRGDVNTYALFAETNRSLVSEGGRAGFIVPSGIATDDTTKVFFGDLALCGSIASLYSFWETRRFFPGTDSRGSFCCLVLRGAGSPDYPAAYAFDLKSADEVLTPGRCFGLTASDVAVLNPNTRTCPIFRSARDAEITKSIYRRVPVLLLDRVDGVRPEVNPWGLSFLAMFHMSGASGLFRVRGWLEERGYRLEGSTFDPPPGAGIQRDDADAACAQDQPVGAGPLDAYLPLYEAKMVHHFDHRFGDYADYPEGAETTHLPDVPVTRLQDPAYQVLPRYWVAREDLVARLRGRWDRGWLMGWRDICRATDERTMIASVLPRVACGDTLLLMLPDSRHARLTGPLVANLNSLVLDYAARQKVGGGHLKYHVAKQLPVLPPSAYEALCAWDSSCGELAQWLLPRVVELSYTAWDLQPFAQDCGFDGPPFRWDEERRFLLRCELDAAYFHLYGISRDDVEYILGTFPIVKRKEEAKWGEYRTQRVILQVFEAMARAMETGESYQTLLDPPPADPWARCG
ncbi:MAG TPA: N-6 DNA methylase [Armatimonadota bacterium]|jgi:hypothetical protein